MRTALPIAGAMLTLRRCEALAATPSAIDDTLASQLVRIHQGRLRFDHERLARFLTAEHLVLSATARHRPGPAAQSAGAPGSARLRAAPRTSVAGR